MSRYLREAVETDMDLLYEWANEKAVRENSFHMEVIPYEEHRKWFQEVLVSSDVKQYIYVYEEEPIGQIRIVVSDDEAEVSYSIASDKRGMGHAEEMLKLLREKVQQDLPQIEKIVAKVKVSNIASQKVFQNLKYTKVYEVYELNMGK